ncbi:MAG: hypothetical protein FWD36_06165 [Treponema sp.]|nr:hypothetical protein [Treponema sp.]
MTEEEAANQRFETFNEFFINNTEKLTFGPNGSPYMARDWLSQREMRAWGLENQAVNYIIKKAIDEHKPPAQIINELVGEKLAVAV